MIQHEWGVCDCVKVFDGVSDKEGGYLHSICFIERPDLCPTKCLICGIAVGQESRNRGKREGE